MLSLTLDHHNHWIIEIESRIVGLTKIGLNKIIGIHPQFFFSEDKSSKWDLQDTVISGAGWIRVMGETEDRRSWNARNQVEWDFP